jgi:1-deoxy-D-xylulose-5-phosphate synthase
MVAVAEQAAERLMSRGLSATVVDARFVKPVDPEIAAVVARHRSVLTIEDGAASGGFGTAVTELLAAEGISVPIRRLGLPDSFIEHGAQARLLAGFGLDAEGVAAAALELTSQQSNALAG